jgi:hypothetical protein
MIVRVASLWVLPETSIFLKAVDRPGIRIAFVEGPGLPLLSQEMVNADLLVGSSKINQPLRCTASPTRKFKVPGSMFKVERVKR